MNPPSRRGIQKGDEVTIMGDSLTPKRHKQLTPWLFQLGIVRRMLDESCLCGVHGRNEVVAEVEPDRPTGRRGRR
jgi:hypothetical protein